MIIIWDERKNDLNWQKHKLGFEYAQKVFSDPHQLNLQDRHVEGEQRWQTIGAIDGIIIVLVAHTIEETEYEEVIRIISARKASKGEREVYAKNR